MNILTNAELLHGGDSLVVDLILILRADSTDAFDEHFINREYSLGIILLLLESEPVLFGCLSISLFDLVNKGLFAELLQFVEVLLCERGHE